MPLDCIEPQPENKALLLVPNATMEHLGHIGHSCRQALWIFMAKSLIARKHGISLNEIFVSTSIEVTTGHLMAYQGKTSVLVVRDQLPQTCIELSEKLPTSQNDEIDLNPHKFECLKNIQGSWRLANALSTYDAPQTTEQMLSDDLEFDIAIVVGPLTMVICETDISKSRVSGQLQTYPPFGSAKFKLGTKHL